MMMRWATKIILSTRRWVGDQCFPCADDSVRWVESADM